MSDMVIRRARPADAEEVSRIARHTFVETFGHLYPPEDLEPFLAHYYAPDKQRELLEQDDSAIWLGQCEGEIVGHALAGPCILPHKDVTASDGEVRRLYLAQKVQGRGWGTKLLHTALDWLERDGPRTLWIGVWSENFGAQRLYARHGFVQVGEYEFPVGQTRDREFILRRSPQRA